MLQGTETLSLRLDRHVENTKKVLEFLSKHPKVAKVNHPSFADHPQHALYKRYFPNGAGSATIRLSIGTEHYEDIIADLDQALNAI